MTETVSLSTPSGLMERAYLFAPAQPNGSGVLFTHGYTTSSSGYVEFAEACTEQSATCLTVDLLSHGQSEGEREELTVGEYLGGLVSAYDYLASRPAVDPRRIGTMAGSFGAYLTVLLSAERPVKSLLLRVPALYPNELRDVPRRSFDTDEVLRTASDPKNPALQIISSFAGKVLLVSSENDEVIMPSTINAYEKALNNKGKHIEMPAATHILDEPDRRLFKGVLLQWVTDL